MARNHSLAQLITTVQQDRGWKDRDLSARATELGVAMKPAIFEHYRTKPLTALNASFITAMAKVLDVPPTAVALAGLNDLRVGVSTEDFTPEAAIAASGKLSERDKALLLVLLAKMTETGN